VERDAAWVTLAAAFPDVEIDVIEDWLDHADYDHLTKAQLVEAFRRDNK